MWRSTTWIGGCGGAAAIQTDQRIFHHSRQCFTAQQIVHSQLNKIIYLDMNNNISNNYNKTQGLVIFYNLLGCEQKRAPIKQPDLTQIKMKKCTRLSRQFRNLYIGNTYPGRQAGIQ